jgi:hypothetical protein
MSRRTRAPETRKIDISHDDWILVKKHLTAGEQRKIFTGMMRENSVTGTPGIDPMKVGSSKIVGYLLDWSFQYFDGSPIVIKNQPEDTVTKALDEIGIDDFAELVRVIDTHEDEMKAAREAEKNEAGAPASAPTSPSPAA